MIDTVTGGDLVRGTPTALATAALLSAALAACGGPAPETASGGQPLSTATESTRSPETTKSPETTEGPQSAGAAPSSAVGADSGAAEEQTPFVPLDQAGQAPGSGSASIVAARLGEHEGYERVVLDLEGEPGRVAGWYATVVPQPLQDASGELLDVEGDRFLDLSITGIANGSDARVDSAGRAAFTGDLEGSGGLVEQVRVGGAWEGQAQVLLGLDEGVSEYRVLRLGEPQRIVVDVR